MLRPTREQQQYQDWEMGAFFHFGIRTFYEGRRDWDGGVMPAEGFPRKLDRGQWIRILRVSVLLSANRTYESFRALRVRNA